MLVETNCFASVSFLLNGYYHHVRSILLEACDDGLHQWVAYHGRSFPNFHRVLMNHYTSLGVLQKINSKLHIIVCHIRIWMLTGRMPRSIFTEIRSKFEEEEGNDIFILLTETLLFKSISAILMSKYHRAEGMIDHLQIVFKFFGLDL